MKDLRKSAMRQSRAPRALRTAAALVLSVSLGFTVGCHRDPNVQKQKYLESGKRYAEPGQAQGSLHPVLECAQVDHNFAEAHYQLATTYLKMGSILPAYAELSRTVALQPNNAQARIDLGSMLIAGGEPDRAEEQAKAVIAFQPNNADAHALLSSVASAQRQQGRGAGADSAGACHRSQPRQLPHPPGNP